MDIDDLMRLPFPLPEQAEHPARIAGAQGADDDVVDRGRILDRPDGYVAGGQADRFRRRVRVLEQQRLECGVGPGAGDQPGAIGRRPRVEPFELFAQFVRRDHALVDQHLAQRLRHHLVLAEGRVLDVRLEGTGVIVSMIVPVVVMIVAVRVGTGHCCPSLAGSSQFS